MPGNKVFVSSEGAVRYCKHGRENNLKYGIIVCILQYLHSRHSRPPFLSFFHLVHETVEPEQDRTDQAECDEKHRHEGGETAEKLGQPRRALVGDVLDYALQPSVVLLEPRRDDRQRRQTAGSVTIHVYCMPH